MKRRASKSIEFILVALITIVMMLSYGLYKKYYEDEKLPENPTCKP